MSLSQVFTPLSWEPIADTQFLFNKEWLTVLEKSALGPPYQLVLDCVSPWMLQGDVEKAVEVLLEQQKSTWICFAFLFKAPNSLLMDNQLTSFRFLKQVYETLDILLYNKL